MSQLLIDPAILWMCRDLLGVPSHVTSSEVVSRMAVERTRYKMGSGVFHGKPGLLSAYEANNPQLFAAELGLSQPPAMVMIPAHVFQAILPSLIEAYKPVATLRAYLS